MMEMCTSGDQSAGVASTLDDKVDFNAGPKRQRGHPGINSLLFLTEGPQFHKFIIITMILKFLHDSAVRWEEVLLVPLGRFPCSMIYAPS